MSGWVLSILWTLGIMIGCSIIMGFIDWVRDGYDLQGTTATEMFKFFVQKLNEVVYHGEGKVTVSNMDTRRFDLYAQGSNQIIEFYYTRGSLTVTWKYKYDGNESTIHERKINDACNLSVISQERIAENLIKEVGRVVRRRRIDVF